MAAEPQPQGVSTARTNGRPADPMNASLTGLLDALRNDAAFASVADGVERAYQPGRGHRLVQS